MTSLSALASSQKPRADRTVAPEPSRIDASKVRGLGKYLALGAGFAFAVTTALSYPQRDSHTPNGDVLHAAPGVKHTQDGKQVRWRTANTTVYIDSSVEKLGPGARDAIKNAFGAWLQTDAHLPGLTFDTTNGMRAEAKPDGKNVVVFAPITLKGHERDLAITLTYSDEKTGDILESDIVINANFPFEVLEPSKKNEREDDDDATVAQNPSSDDEDPSAVSDADNLRVNSTVQTETRSSCVAQQVKASCGRDVYDVENVVTHEVGHFFGLGEDVADTSSTMYVCTNRCETHKRELTASDTTVLAALYPEDLAEISDATAAGCTGARLAPSGTPATGAIAALLAGLLLAARRKR